MSDYNRIWIVTRHGSNAANQSMTPEMILGTVEAGSSVEAKAIAAEEFTCYANQYFSVKSFAEADSESRNAAFEADEADKARNQLGEWKMA